MLAKKLMGATSANKPLYVDDVFSTFLRTGTGANVTITTGIDMTEGFMLWSKGRSGATDHAVYDSERGVTKDLVTNSINGEETQANGLKAVSESGHTIGSLAKMNTSGQTYVDWVFRRANRFFDVVTYTGNGVSGRQIPHELGCEVGVIASKSTSTTGDWNVYHRSATGDLNLNLTDAQTGSRTLITAANDSTFTVSGVANTNGVTYVAYLWAHDPSEDGIVQCGSFITNAAAVGEVILGWEPQFVIVKQANGASQWSMLDTMRGWNLASGGDARLYSNLSNVESLGNVGGEPNSTGFRYQSSGVGENNIYLAIRRPNKPPKSGAEVYVSSAASGVINTGFPVDLHIGATRAGSSTNHSLHDRLRGGTKELASSSTAAESTVADLLFDRNSGLRFSFPLGQINHFFRRCPSFHDQICYTGAGSNKTEAHNLGKQPELWFAKRSNAAGSWVWGSTLLNANEKIVMPSPNGRVTDATAWNSAYPTDSNISLGTLADVNASGGTYTMYLWATCLGVSKVGKYTGNGSSQQIDCGFSTGARFAMVIRLTAGVAQDIYLWDSARGITSGNDPRLSLNTTAAEVTGLDTIDPHASGFIVNQDASNVNVSGAEYIFLAIS